MSVLLLSAFLLSAVLVTAQIQEPFITQIRDLVIGKGASYTEVELYRQDFGECEDELHRQDDGECEENADWVHVASNVTDINGRIPNLVTTEEFPLGVYKLIFQTKKYYAAKNYTTIYPYMEIIFEKSTPDQILIVVSLSPYGFSFYKGVNGIK